MQQLEQRKAMINRPLLWIFAVSFFTLSLMPGINWLLLQYANLPENTTYYPGRGSKPDNWQMLFSGFIQYRTLAITFLLSLIVTLLSSKFLNKTLARPANLARFKTISFVTLICSSVYCVYRIIQVISWDIAAYGDFYDEIITEIIFLAILDFLLLFPSSFLVMRNGLFNT